MENQNAYKHQSQRDQDTTEKEGQVTLTLMTDGRTYITRLGR